MHRADINAALTKVKSSGSRIARALACSQPAVQRVIAGKARSCRVEQRIAEVTGLSLSQLWPQWYSPAPVNPKERGISLVGFRARLRAEFDRLDLPAPAIAAIARVSVEDVNSWRRDGGEYPPVPCLIWLSQSTRIDLAYVMTGRREVTNG